MTHGGVLRCWFHEVSVVKTDKKRSMFLRDLVLTRRRWCFGVIYVDRGCAAHAWGPPVQHHLVVEQTNEKKQTKKKDVVDHSHTLEVLHAQMHRELRWGEMEQNGEAKGKRRSEHRHGGQRPASSHFPNTGRSTCMKLDTARETVTRSHGNLRNAVMESVLLSSKVKSPVKSQTFLLYPAL